MKTSELIDLSLDWAVAYCEKLPVWLGNFYSARESGCALQVEQWPGGATTLKWIGGGAYSPSTNWSQGGRIIDQENINITGPRSRRVAQIIDAEGFNFIGVGPTSLIAAMRCYVASKLGDEVEIPKELL